MQLLIKNETYLLAKSLPLENPTKMQYSGIPQKRNDKICITSMLYEYNTNLRKEQFLVSCRTGTLDVHCSKNNTNDPTVL